MRSSLLATLQLLALAPALAREVEPPVTTTPPLIAAIRNAHREQVEALLRQPNALRTVDGRGNTALHWAALAREPRLVSRLLAAGLDLRATNAAGATPLHYGTGDERIVRVLLRAGADPNARSVDGATPLHTAAARPGSQATVRRLLDAGAAVDATRPAFLAGFDTALSLAITYGDERVARLLLAHGAHPGGTNGFTAVSAAAYVGRGGLLQDLLDRGGEVNPDDGFAGHPLNNAFYTGHRSVVPLLVKRGTDLHRRSSFGEQVPPMVWATYNETGDPTAARVLLGRGVDVNEPTGSGHTALDWALKRGETPLTAYLRSQGAVESASATRKKSPPDRAVPADPAARREAVRDSIRRALGLLQRSSDGFLDNAFVQQSGCVSCHQQTLPAVALGRARERGFDIDDASLARQLQVQHTSWSRTRDTAYELREPQPDAPANLGYGLFGLKSVGYEADELTDAMVWYLAESQLPDGSFSAYDRRPPMEEGQVVGTALAVGALRSYPQPVRRAGLERQIAKARRWLERVEPEDPSQELFRLLGLAWAGATPAQLSRSVRELVAAQRMDGGWAPLPTLESDAWATGMTLFVLHEAGGVPADDGAYRRGVEFLLRTQFEDGSWWVRSRTWPFQPHFDSGFPHGKDQWISAGGTAWAALALLNALPPAVGHDRFPPAQVLMAQHARPAGALPGPAPGPAAAAASSKPADSPFVRDILPLLDRSCAGCHGGEAAKGKFRVDALPLLLKGGQSGEPAVVPGRPDTSPLVRYVSDQVEDLEMPPLAKRTKYPALTGAELDRLKAWIAAGAH